MATNLDEFNSIRKDCWLPFASSGSWSTHQLLEKLVGVIGPCHASISTFTVSEESLRALWAMVKDEKLFSFTLVADHSAFRNKKSLMMFASNIPHGEVFTSNLHAKFIILQNDSWKITVLTSANMTPNPRIEAGVICSVEGVTKYYLSVIAEIIKKSTRVKFNE